MKVTSSPGTRITKAELILETTILRKLTPITARIISLETAKGRGMHRYGILWIAVMRRGLIISLRRAMGN